MIQTEQRTRSIRVLCVWTISYLYDTQLTLVLREPLKTVRGSRLVVFRLPACQLNKRWGEAYPPETIAGRSLTWNEGGSAAACELQNFIPTAAHCGCCVNCPRDDGRPVG